MAAIEARGLTKVYRVYKKEEGLMGAVKGLFVRKYDEVRAADDVSFTIEEGEIVGFLGPNGAGKTTTLKMLSGLLHPTAGDARVLGFVPWERKYDFKRQFALLMGQKNALWWDLPALESLELNRAIYEIDKTAFRKLIDELTTLLDVKDKLGTMVRELSLGERMKMEIIAALIHSPRVLFLDEPTIGLDVISQRKVREFLRYYNRERKIVTILTSHYMQDIEALCPRVIMIDHGKIFYDGALAEIVEKFEDEKMIELEFDEPVTTDFARFGNVVERTDRSVKLRVARKKVTDVCREILGECKVSDIRIQETPIEEIIRRFLERNAPPSKKLEELLSADSADLHR